MRPARYKPSQREKIFYRERAKLANTEIRLLIPIRRLEESRLNLRAPVDLPNHICALYDSGDVRDDMIERFLRDGLDQGDKCVCFIGHEREFVERCALADRPTREQLEFHSADEAYLANGAFSKEIMIERLARHVTSAMNDGYAVTRIVGDMSWVIRCGTDPQLVLAYEAEVNDFARRLPQIALCLYDLSEFDGAVIVDVLRTHPKIYLNGMIVANPYFAATRRAAGAA